MDRVIIGVDPPKRSLTFEARDTREVLRPARDHRSLRLAG